MAHFMWLQSILDATVEAELYLVQPWRRFIGFLPSVRQGKQKFEVFKNFIRQLLCEVSFCMSLSIAGLLKVPKIVQ